MSRYSRYQEQNLVYYMIKGYTKCNNYTASNVQYCDSYFSDIKFDSLKRQKEALKKSVKDQRAEVARLAAVATSAFAALAAAQEKEMKLDERLDKLTAR
ncbi:hypothetical protein PV08_05171 [Exophiala spinifera]|uniref:Uncharacterized protein n=1 Tax=Exophiala spinifera TaxID=91928 RepID=A0A0D1YRX2_9EURO|nr:uncharacterized protein PV08_05171 [Exophiala spinifera]KIW17976.1 hypothetical protein PV08_05171 [Exophiala spinifera]